MCSAPLDEFGATVDVFIELAIVAALNLGHSTNSLGNEQLELKNEYFATALLDWSFCWL